MRVAKKRPPSLGLTIIKPYSGPMGYYGVGGILAAGALNGEAVPHRLDSNVLGLPVRRRARGRAASGPAWRLPAQSEHRLGPGACRIGTVRRGRGASVDDVAGDCP